MRYVNNEEFNQLKYRVKQLEQKLREMTENTWKQVDVRKSTFDDRDRLIDQCISEPSKYAAFSSDLMSTKDIVIALDVHFAHIDNQYWVWRNHQFYNDPKNYRSHNRKLALRLSKQHNLENRQVSTYLTAEDNKIRTCDEKAGRSYTSANVWVLRNNNKYKDVNGYKLAQIYEQQINASRKLMKERHPELCNPYYKPESLQKVSFL